MNIEAIATKLAQLMKAANDDDAGYFAHYFDDAVYDDEGNGPIWTAICDRAEKLLPTVKAPREMVEGFSRAAREFNACQSYEREQLGYGA
jgi:hypothetical protein